MYIDLSVRFHTAYEVKCAVYDYFVPFDDQSMETSLRIYIGTIIIIKPHHSTTYVDAAYCYLPSSVVCLFVSLSVGLSPSEPCKNGQ